MAYVDICILRHLNAELGCTIEKWLRLIINTMLFRTVLRTTKNLKNKAVFNLKQYCMHCFVTLSNIFWSMHMKMWFQYSLLRRPASYKVYLCFIVLLVAVCSVGYVCLFREEIFVDFVTYFLIHDNWWSFIYIMYKV